jgi:hypothetical protein
VVPTGIVMWVYKLTQEFPERRFNQEVRQDFPPDLVQDVEQSIPGSTGSSRGESSRRIEKCLQAWQN